jgi:hemoglobin
MDLYAAAFDAADMPTDPAFRRAVMEHIEFGTAVAQQNSHAESEGDLHPLREVPLWTMDHPEP